METPFAVRVVYIVPEDAEPWPEAGQRATDVLEDLQHFFADEMVRLGYEPKTFRIAHNEEGALLFRQIRSRHSIEEFLIENPGHNPAYINFCKEAAGQHGLRNTNDIVIYFFEAYSIEQNKVVAGSRGMQRGRGGEAFLSCLHLKLALREWLSCSEGYVGQVFPWITSTPLWEGALSWEGRGQQLGDVAGAGFGAIAHEFTHCFGTSNHKSDLDVEKRNENLMGTGFRRMREYFRPDPTKGRCILSYRVANLLDTNDEFFASQDLKPKGDHFLLSE